MKHYRAAAILAALLIPAIHANASESAARTVCKDFIERSGYRAQDWGEYWKWTTIDNKDGSWSVGARFVGMPPGGGSKNLYVTCIANKKGDNWKLERLVRIQ